MAAVTPSNAPGVESLPPHIRQQTIDRLLSGESARAVSRYLDMQGYKLSHAAVARYNSKVVRPALKTGAKLQRLQSLAETPREQLVETAALTQEALAADPILSRIRAKQARMDRVLVKAEESENYSAVAALEAADTRALDLEARVTGRLQATTNSTTIQVAVMYQAAPPAQIAESQGEIIDVDVAEVKRD
jgi:hypothetical protein